MYQRVKIYKGKDKNENFLSLFNHVDTFIVLFALAGFGLEVLEGRKIRTSEYMTGFRDLGVGYMFLMGSFAFILYPISFYR